MKRKLAVAFLAMFALLFVSTSAVLADGNCSQLQMGHESSWSSYDAGSETVEVRGCNRPDGSFSFLDVRNPHGYNICVNVMNDSNGQKWTHQPLGPYDIFARTVSGMNTQWRVGAKRMSSKGYCD